MEKRAVKRGDIERSDLPSSSRPHRKPSSGRSHAQLRDKARSSDPDTAAAATNFSAKIEATRRLQSAFHRVSPAFLAAWQEKASNDALRRPIPSTSIVFDRRLVHQPHSNDLIMPKRPKWRYEMSKEEVEKNEEGWFKRWLIETERTVNQWKEALPPDVDEASLDPETKAGMLTLRSPTFYEQNLEVWRQL